ncbi:MAG TPA: hypothetical protein VMW47_09350 [Verrucomicrobiae bacterium]|nr:hypothetical protein [Verrucomicrobiae bacterium]
MALFETRRALKNIVTDLAIVAVPLNLGPDEARTTPQLRAHSLRRTPPPAVARPESHVGPDLVAHPH